MACPNCKQELLAIIHDPEAKRETYVRWCERCGTILLPLKAGGFHAKVPDCSLAEDPAVLETR